VELNEADPTLELEARIAVNSGEALVAFGARAELGEGWRPVTSSRRRRGSRAPRRSTGSSSERRPRPKRSEYRDAPPVDAKGKTNPLLRAEAYLRGARPCWRQLASLRRL
jgi:hypothetical protein